MRMKGRDSTRGKQVLCASLWVTRVREAERKTEREAEREEEKETEREEEKETEREAKRGAGKIST